MPPSTKTYSIHFIHKNNLSKSKYFVISAKSCQSALSKAINKTNLDNFLLDFFYEIHITFLYNKKELPYEKI